MAKNPDWSSVETAVLLENYQTREMHELQEILAKCYFPRPPEGIKRRLEILYRDGLPLDIKRIEHLRKRKLWRKEDYQKFKKQLHTWRGNNPRYFSRWLKEHPDYLRQWLDEHKGYSKMSWKRFCERHPNYKKRYNFYIRRNIDNLLMTIFNDKQDLSSNEIYSRIKNLTGISLKERTLEKLLLKYGGLPRGSPVIKIESENYQLNPSFYNS